MLKVALDIHQILMLKNKIYNYFFNEFFRNFLIILLIFTIIAWVVRAVNFLDLMVEDGYSTGIRNCRGAHAVDPEAKPERALAEKYRQRADQVENAGYQRLATTLRGVADSYDRDAERIISRSGVLHWGTA